MVIGQIPSHDNRCSKRGNAIAPYGLVKEDALRSIMDLMNKAIK